MNRASKDLYVKGVNRVQDYIENHLDEPLTVKELSRIAAFSEFHFQRIFSSLTGETLFGFIKRLRLEKASFMLLSDKERSITDIALSVGFSNQASFAKAFKQKFGISSSNYRKQNGSVVGAYFEEGKEAGPKVEIEPLEIKIRKEEARDLIYLRYTGSYKGEGDLFLELFQRLYLWADKRALISPESRWYVIYHDFGTETDEEQLRLSVCMSVDFNVAVSGEVGFLSLQEGTYAEGSFLVEPSEYSKAWYYMYAKWLPESGRIPDDRFPLEYYPPAELSGAKRLVEIWIPL